MADHCVSVIISDYFLHAVRSVEKGTSQCRVQGTGLQAQTVPLHATGKLEISLHKRKYFPQCTPDREREREIHMDL